VVPDYQLSLAIGKEGQNARLAARLTGWRIDIRSETEFATEEQDGDYGGEEELDGRCHAILTNGRRCPNAALPQSRYCGLDAHQALATIDSDSIADLSGNGAAADGAEVPEPGEVAVADEPVVEEPLAAEPVPAGETPAVESDEALAGSAADELEPQADASEPTGEV
jgi:N utilization substance protein A